MKKIFLILNFIFIFCFIGSYAQAGVKEPGLGNFSDNCYWVEEGYQSNLTTSKSNNKKMLP